MSEPTTPRFNPVRALYGGFLMGLANLVPGVSGGTMILALGLYDRFIAALAGATRLAAVHRLPKVLREEARSLSFLALIGVGAVVAILSLSGVAVGLVTEHRWVMYSLFIGMTLGGVPELWRLSRPPGVASAVAFLAALGLMALLARGLADARIEPTPITLTLVAALAASSMILPGVSGSYILLIFGMYDVVLSAVRPRALIEDGAESLAVIVPVGVGVVLGIALLSNALKVLLARVPRPSHAALLGLLLGSVLGLFPFREPVHPELVDKPYRKAVAALVAGESVQEANSEQGTAISASEAVALRGRYAGKSAGDLKRMSEELRGFTPGVGQVAAALGLVALGLLGTLLLGRKEAPRAGAAA